MHFCCEGKDGFSCGSQSPGDFNSTMCFVSLVCLARLVRLVCLVRLISLVSLRAGIGGKTTKASNAANGTRKQTMGKFLLLPYPATGLRS